MAKTVTSIVACEECGNSIKRSIPVDKPRKSFCGLDCKAEYQKRARLLTKDQLHDLYVVQGLDCRQIGDMVGRDPKSIWNWITDFGIPTRGRGEDGRQHFKKGHDLCVGRVLSDETKEKLRKARIADGSKCFFLPNGDHVLKGKRGPDHPRWQGGSTPVRQKFYSSDEWKEACVAVWHRDDAICQRCNLDHRTIDRDKQKFHVHHIFGFTRYPKLRADVNNLVLLCDKCHRWVHSKKNVNKEWIGNETT